MALLRSSINSPLGEIEVFSYYSAIACIRFFGQKPPAWLMEEAIEGEDEAIIKAKEYLSKYFSGERPDVDFPLFPAKTHFQAAVREELLSLPFGQTISYGELARRVEFRLGRKSYVRAVAMALSHNPILIAIPCHRVILSSGDIGGYAGSKERKAWLLEFEKSVLPIQR